MRCNGLAAAGAAMFFALLSLQIEAALGLAAEPTPTRRDVSFKKSINPGPDSLTYVERIPQVKKRYITNAERLASGLPLNPPVRRKDWEGSNKAQAHAPRHHDPHHPHPSSTASKIQSGFIQIFDSSSGDLVGFVANSFNMFGEYTSTSDLGQALAVQIDTGLASEGVTNIATTNGPDVNFPFFGAITGFGDDSPDLGPGSSNYVYLGGVEETSQNSPPVQSANSFSSALHLTEEVESAIWSIDSDGTLTCHWTNQDLSTPSLFAGIAEGALMYTGDPDAFNDEFSQMQSITFKFVPTS